MEGTFCPECGPKFTTAALPFNTPRGPKTLVLIPEELTGVAILSSELGKTWAMPRQLALHTWLRVATSLLRQPANICVCFRSNSCDSWQCEVVGSEKLGKMCVGDAWIPS